MLGARGISPHVLRMRGRAFALISVFIALSSFTVAPCEAQTPWQWQWDSLGPRRMSQANGAINIPVPHPTDPNIVYVGAVNVRRDCRRARTTIFFLVPSFEDRLLERRDCSRFDHHIAWFFEKIIVHCAVRSTCAFLFWAVG